MPEITSLRDRVDFLINSDKTLVGDAEWNRTSYEGQHRWLSVTAIEGRPTDLMLVVDAYPDSEVPKFTINLLYKKSVMRLDYGEAERHRNHTIKKIPTPRGLKMGMIYGSHVHPWSMNRVLASHSTLPDILEFAEPIPQNVRHFDQAFRVFCDAAHITVPAASMPSLPVRELLV